MMQRILVIAPEALVDDANQWERCVAASEAFRPPFVVGWRRGDERYAVTAPRVRPEWLDTAQAAPQEPPWGADMEAAGRAWAALDFPAEDAPPDRISALLIGDNHPLAVLADLGIERIMPVDINYADSAQLQSLDGVGASLGEAIIAGRPWDDPADLSQISGISDAMVAGWMAEPGLVAKDEGLM